VIALVTGASQGIGRATALALAARGVDVALVARTRSTLDEARGEIVAKYASVRACSIEADVGDRASVDAMHGRVMRELGLPDVLVLAAGIVRRKRLEEMSDADWDDVLTTNLRSLFLATRAFVPAMKARGAPARIVIVGSISGTLGTASLTSYCASKWATIGFTKALAEELRGTTVSVVCLNPGSVDTAMLAGSGFPPQMTAEEVAGELVHLALDASPAMHGASIDMFGDRVGP